MAKKFRGSFGKTAKKYYLKEKRNLYLEFIASSLVITMLVIGAIIALFYGDKLNSEDLPNQPPNLYVFQKLFYYPSETEKPKNSERDIYDDFGGPIGDESSNGKVNVFVSKPKLTAVIGKEYQYHPKSRDKIKNLKLSIAPSGMRIDSNSGEIKWIPKVSDIGVHDIKIEGINKNAQKAIQRFSIHVSRHLHILGTDTRGRDVLFCLIIGSRWAVLAGTIAVLTSMLLGLSLGGIAGYYGGWIDNVISLFINLFAAFPALLLIFLAAAISHYSLYVVMFTVGLAAFPRIAMAIKTKVKSLKENQYIEAAKELGLRDIEILWKDIIWYNSRNIIVDYIMNGFAFAIIIEVTLSYLRLGEQKYVSWGNMLLEGKNRFQYNNEAWLFFLPVITIIMAILSFYLLSDSINKLSKIRK